MLGVPRSGVFELGVRDIVVCSAFRIPGVKVNGLRY